MPDTFKVYASQVTSTNAVTVVSAVTGTRIINAIHVANASTAATSSISVQVFAGTNGFTLVPLHQLGTQTSTQLLVSPLGLQTEDDVKASLGSGTAALDVIVSSLERTDD